MSERNRTPLEVLEKRKDIFGEEEGLRFNRIISHWCKTWLVWNDFKELFLTNPEIRHKILKDSAGHFFDTYHRIALQEIILGTTRLLENNKNGVSLPTLIGRLKASDACKLDQFKTIDEHLKVAIDAGKSFRFVRNKIYAHSDSDTSKVPVINYKELGACLDSIHSVINQLTLQFENTQMANEVLCSGDGSLALLYVLRDGLKNREEFDERMAARSYTSEDIAYRQLPI